MGRIGSVAVVGAGAVGCYYGAMLARAGVDVRFLFRSDLEAVRAGGLEVRSVGGDFRLAEVQAYGSAEEMGVCDLVIVALKATANLALEKILPPLLGEGTVVLTLQNGLGNVEFLARRWGAGRVLGGLCFVCINRVGAGVIEHTAEGRIALGDAGAGSDKLELVAALMRSAGVRVDVVGDLGWAQWKKLVWNVPFNGLSIVGGGIDTGQILGSPPLVELVRGLMGEVVAAAAAQGHEMPVGLAEGMIESTRGMGGYRPSSLIDHELGREVEVEAIWGEPLRRARACGLEMGHLGALYGLLRHLCGGP